VLIECGPGVLASGALRRVPKLAARTSHRVISRSSGRSEQQEPTEGSTPVDAHPIKRFTS
jgi:hypothetical protein